MPAQPAIAYDYFAATALSEVTAAPMGSVADARAACLLRVAADEDRVALDARVEHAGLADGAALQ
jgi:hypothetical protein